MNVVLVVVVVLVVLLILLKYLTPLHNSTSSSVMIAAPLLTVFSAQFIVSLSIAEDVKTILFCTTVVDYCTHNVYSFCITFLGIAHSNCTAETKRLCRSVDVQCCMSIVAIATVTNNLSAVPLALLLCRYIVLYVYWCYC